MSGDHNANQDTVDFSDWKADSPIQEQPVATIMEPAKLAFYFCNKCGYYGKDGPLHNVPDIYSNTIPCKYHATKDGPWYSAEQLQSISDKLAEVEKQRDELQAKVDSLMLEYCPEEMTPEQIENWGKHQVIGEGVSSMETYIRRCELQNSQKQAPHRYRGKIINERKES
jgi:hypothetical protein